MAKAKTTETPTIVTFLLDRTQSMSRCKSATIEAFNGYIDGLKNGTAKILFTFLQFDSISLDKVCVAEPIKNVVPLTDATYQPRASTPLIDSCVKTIRAVEESLTKRDDKPKVVVCFQTDGEENSSTEHTWDELNALIKAKSAEGWQFNFMGAGIDAYAHASKMGIAASNAASYDHTNLGATRAVFVAQAANTQMFGSGARSDTSYLMSQRDGFGDKFAPADLTGKPKDKKDGKGQKVKAAPIVDDFTL